MTTFDANAAARAAMRDPQPVSPYAAAWPRLMLVDETASYCSCSRRQVRYWLARGLLHPVRLDRRLRIDRHEVDRLVEAATRRDLRAPRPGATSGRRADPLAAGPQFPGERHFIRREAQP